MKRIQLIILIVFIIMALAAGAFAGAIYLNRTNQNFQSNKLAADKLSAESVTPNEWASTILTKYPYNKTTKYGVLIPEGESDKVVLLGKLQSLNFSSLTVNLGEATFDITYSPETAFIKTDYQKGIEGLQYIDVRDLKLGDYLAVTIKNLNAGYYAISVELLK